MAISVHVRPPVNTNGVSDFTPNGHSCIGHSRTGSFSNLAGKPDSPTVSGASGGPFSGTNGGSRLSPTMTPRKASIIPLATMSTARCAMGAVELDGKLVVCGETAQTFCLFFCFQPTGWNVSIYLDFR